MLHEPFSAGRSSLLVSLVIPVYNEQDNLAPLFDELHAAMQRQPRDWNVYFIDDGSTDASLGVLRALAERHGCVRYLSFAENAGQSAAFAAGFQHADGDVLVTLDADMQNDPSDIPAMLNLYDQGFDVVAGWRSARADGVVKRVSSKIANAVRNTLSRECVKDTGCSLKVLRADMARRMPMFRGMHRFFPTLMKMQGATMAQMPVRHRPRLHGVSKYGIWDRAFTAFHDLLAVRWMLSRAVRYSVKERR